MPQIIVLLGSHSSHTTDFWEVFRWLEMPWRLLMNCFEDIYWKWIFMKRHKHSSWIFFNSVQQLDSGRTRQAWQMSLQPMVQLYKRNVSGESGDQNKLHFGDHWFIKSSFCGYPTEPPRWTWRSTFMTFVYMTSFTWQAFTWRNYCMTHDCMKSICMKYICMIKVTITWQNKTMIHINTQMNNINMTTHIHEYHPHDTKEQLYDVRLHDVQLHDVANTWFVNACHVNEVMSMNVIKMLRHVHRGGSMRTLLTILC